jgi:hypothetical protein
VYEISDYLGGGASGSVHQALDLVALGSSLGDDEGDNLPMVAIKILNPIGYKLLPGSQIKECIIFHKGALDFSIEAFFS